MELTITVDPVMTTFGPATITWSGAASTLGLALAIMLGIVRARRRDGVALSLLLKASAWGVALGLLVRWGLATWNLASPGGDLSTGIATGAGLAGAAAVASWPAERPCAGGERLTRWGATTWSILEVALPGLLLGQALADAGSLMAGGQWGQPTGGAWGVVYWHPRALLPPPLLGVPLHPIALYLATANLLIAGLLLLWPRDPAMPRLVLALAGYGGAHLALRLLGGRGMAL